MPREHPSEATSREVDQLRARIAELENELADSQEVIAAIRSGEVDAVVVSGPEGEQVFTLRGAEAAYRELVETMNEGAATISSDRTLLYCNQQLASLLGIPLDQIMGRQLDDFLDVDAMAVAQVLIARALHGAPAKAELTVLSQEGSRVPIQLSVSRMKIEEPTALCLVATDLTRLASEQRLRTAAEIANLGSWDLDLESGRMICSEQCKKNYGWPLDRDFNYQDLRAGIHPDDAAAMAEAVNTALATHTMYRAEYRNIWPDGSMHWVIAAGRAQYDDGDRPVSMAGFTLDVTDRHKAQEALLQSEKLAAVGRLASSIAHEINNPLESVTNLLYLANGSDDVAAIKGHLAIADLELRRVSAITNQTLRFHRQSGKTKAVTGPELFESVLSMFERRLENGQIKVVVQVRSKGVVHCLDGEIRQVLTNLVSNAIDAMPPGGCMLLRSRDAHSGDTRGVWFTVADNGAGIPAKVRDKVFEAFYSTKGINGTGLGLWISQEIVQRHGGRLILRSRTAPEDHGTVFSLFLPCESPLYGGHR